MRFVLAALSACVMISPAMAFSPQEPVKTLVDATVENWAGTNEEFKYVLDDAYLNSVYSKAFAKAYRDAGKKLSQDAGEGEEYPPFGYDIITNSQDGCPLQDVKTDKVTPKDKGAEVIVSFKHYACMGDEADYQIRSVVHFDVIEEDGKAVIDNIRHKTDEGFQSLRGELDDILKGQ